MRVAFCTATRRLFFWDPSGCTCVTPVPRLFATRHLLNDRVPWLKVALVLDKKSGRERGRGRGGCPCSHSLDQTNAASRGLNKHGEDPLHEVSAPYSSKHLRFVHLFGGLCLPFPHSWLPRVQPRMGIGRERPGARRPRPAALFLLSDGPRAGASTPSGASATHRS